MHGCRQGYKRQYRWHCPYSPYDERVYRTVAITLFAGVLAIAFVQGCRGRVEFSGKGFSSPSSEAGRRVAPGFFQRNYLSASAGQAGISSCSHDAGILESTRTEGKDAQPGAVSSPRTDDLLDAIALVESNNRANAVGDGGSAVGAYQIRPIFLRDVNRILGWNKYELTDRWDPEKSRAMARVYLDHYGGGLTLIDQARQYNGGPRGHLKRATEPFAIKIQAAMSAGETATEGHLVLSFKF